MTDVDPSVRLATLLGVDVVSTRPLARVGVRELADMAGWELADLEAVVGVGPGRLAVLVPALRKAGVRLPGGSQRERSRSVPNGAARYGG